MLSPRPVLLLLCCLLGPSFAQSGRDSFGSSGDYSSPYGADDCDPDKSLFYDAVGFFAISPSCRLVFSARDPVTVDQLEQADRLDPKLLRTQCLAKDTSVFPIGDDDIGIIRKEDVNEMKYFAYKMKDHSEAIIINIAAVKGKIFQGEDWHRTCHLSQKKRTIRCMNLRDKGGEKEIAYTDYEGDNEQIKKFKNRVWPLPPTVNVKTKDVLSYYDEFTQSDHIWMEHNLQWLYNVDMDEQELRGNKSIRLTTYHLSNRLPDRSLIVPVYADSSGLVTAHCETTETNCRYVYNRVDAKSAMESTCLLEHPFLITLGVVVPPRRVQVDEVDETLMPPAAEPLIQRHKDSEEKDKESFWPIYVLALLTFILVCGMIILHFQPVPGQPLIDLYKKLDNDITAWLYSYNKWKRRREHKSTE